MYWSDRKWAHLWGQLAQLLFCFLFPASQKAKGCNIPRSEQNHQGNRGVERLFAAVSWFSCLIFSFLLEYFPFWLVFSLDWGNMDRLSCGYMHNHAFERCQSRVCLLTAQLKGTGVTGQCSGKFTADYDDVIKEDNLFDGCDETHEASSSQSLSACNSRFVTVFSGFRVVIVLCL